MVKFMSEGRGSGYGRGPPREEGVPDEVMEVGEIVHCSEENQLLCKATIWQSALGQQGSVSGKQGGNREGRWGPGACYWLCKGYLDV